jgi:patatin-like phospholipase/acyl hydrolase
MFRVLSLDGGGIRGVFTAQFLQHFESGPFPLHQCFELVVGTSTGGIIALALAHEKKMREVAKIYSDFADEIFPTRRFSKARGLFSAKYDNLPLIARAKSIFGASTKFDLPSCRVRIASYDLQIGAPKIFRGGPSDPHFLDKDFLVWQIAVATSAAPMYFPTFSIAEKGVFVDGGVWANNPSLIAISEAMKLGVPLDQIRLLSVGTGASIFRHEKPRSGLLSWGLDLVEMTFQSQSDGVDQLVSGLPLNHYRRVSPHLQRREAALDSKPAVTLLKRLAGTKYEEHREELSKKYFFGPL